MPPARPSEGRHVLLPRPAARQGHRLSSQPALVIHGFVCRPVHFEDFCCVCPPACCLSCRHFASKSDPLTHVADEIADEVCGRGWPGP